MRVEPEKDNLWLFALVVTPSPKPGENIWSRTYCPRRKIFAIGISDKGLISRIYKEHIQINKKKITKLIK